MLLTSSNSCALSSQSLPTGIVALWAVQYVSKPAEVDGRPPCAWLCWVPSSWYCSEGIGRVSCRTLYSYLLFFVRFSIVKCLEPKACLRQKSYLLSYKNSSKTSHYAFPETRCLVQCLSLVMGLPWQRPSLNRPFCPPSPIVHRLDMTVTRRSWILWGLNPRKLAATQTQTEADENIQNISEDVFKTSCRLQTKCLLSVS